MKPRQRAHEANSIGVAARLRRHVVVHELRRFERDFRVAPVTVRAGQCNDGQVDPGLIHRAQARLVVEHAGRECHERGAPSRWMAV